MASTFDISPIDFKTRMQQIACCLASKGTIVSDKLKGGKSCHEEVLRLQVAHAMYDLLKCYGYNNASDTLPYYVENGGGLFKFTIEAGLYESLTINVNGYSYPDIDITGLFLDDVIQLVRTAIGSDLFNIEITLNQYGGASFVTITGPCHWSGLEVSIYFSIIPAGPEGEAITTIFSGTYTECVTGDLDAVNCTTTDQVHSRFEWFQEYCDICFDADYNYYEQIPPTIYYYRS